MFSSKLQVTALTAATLLACAVQAQSFDLSWHSINGGGATFSTGGGFALGSTIGQLDAGTMSGGSYALTGGFWSAAAAPCTLAADLDGDSDVDLTDLAALLSHFGTPSGATHASGDVDGDGDVDLQDLAVLLAEFGTICT